MEAQPMPQKRDHMSKAQEPMSLKRKTNEDLLDCAKQTLVEICNDKDAGASARSSAARTLLELVGAIKNSGASQGLRPTVELSSDELDRLIQDVSQRTNKGDKDEQERT
jgi:hypothetical protein